MATAEAAVLCTACVAKAAGGAKQAAALSGVDMEVGADEETPENCVRHDNSCKIRLAWLSGD